MIIRVKQNPNWLFVIFLSFALPAVIMLLLAAAGFRSNLEFVYVVLVLFAAHLIPAMMHQKIA